MNYIIQYYKKVFHMKLPNDIVKIINNYDYAINYVLLTKMNDEFKGRCRFIEFWTECYMGLISYGYGVSICFHQILLINIADEKHSSILRIL